jgi:hypothetical protein
MNMNTCRIFTKVLFVLLAFPFLAYGQLKCYPPAQPPPCVAFGLTTTPVTNSNTASYYNNSGDHFRPYSTSASGPFSAQWPELQQFAYNPIPVTFNPTVPGTYSGSVSATYEDEVYTGNFITITITASGEFAAPGFVNPKYLVVGVWYAPPGSQSNACYGSNTVVGNSTSVSSSFSLG